MCIRGTFVCEFSSKALNESTLKIPYKTVSEPGQLIPINLFH